MPETEAAKQLLWLWQTTKGHIVNVYPVKTDVSDWFPESPYERPPQTYRIDNNNTGESILTTVFPLEPWSAYDAIGDRLAGWGWTDTTYEDPGTCEHGMSAALCEGPNHYPMDL